MIVCESEWHKKIELKHFDKCPICGSTAYHKVPFIETVEVEA